MTFILAAIIGAALGVIVWAFVKPPEPKPIKPKTDTKAAAVKEIKQPPTIHDLFKDDFALLSRSGELEFKIGPQADKVEPYRLEFRIWDEFSSNSKFIGIYIPHNPYLFDLLMALPDKCQDILSTNSGNFTLPPASVAGKGSMIRVDPNPEHHKVTYKNPGDASWSDESELRFSGKIYLYYEDQLSLSQLGKLDEWYRSKSLFPQFRGQEYATDNFLKGQTNEGENK